MKNIFLYKNALPRKARGFLKLGLSVMITALFCLSGYAQSSSTTGEMQHLYLKFHKNDTDTPDCIEIKPLSDDGTEDFSYGYHGEVDTETATLRLFDNSIGFHAQLTLMTNVPNSFLRFGVSIGDFKRNYNIRSDATGNTKLHYNWGHIDPSQGAEINVYYDGTFYQVHYDDVQIECEEIGTFSGLREVFVSTYGRTNIGQEVNLSFASYDGSLEACRLPAFKCLDASIGVNHNNCELVYLDCEESEQTNCYTASFSPSISCNIDIINCSVDDGNKLSTEIQDFTVHPNPASNRLAITLTPLVNETIKINIIDAIGRVVSHQTHNGLAQNTSTIDFDITDLNPGIYYIKIDSEYKFETKKIIIIK